MVLPTVNSGPPVHIQDLRGLEFLRCGKKCHPPGKAEFIIPPQHGPLLPLSMLMAEELIELKG